MDTSNDTTQEPEATIHECDRVSATVVALDDKTARVTLEGGAEGVIQRQDLMTGQGDWPIAVGQQFIVWVDQKISDSEYLVSKSKAEKLAIWDRVAGAAERKETIEGEVIAVIKGGLSVDIGLRAFVPSSQIELRQTDDLTKYLGQNLEFVITKFNKRRGNCVLSRRPILERERQALSLETLERLEAEQVLDGRVVGLTNYGAFVDIGGIDGLVHLDELSWLHITHPSQAVTVGDEVRVKVLDVDRKKQRVSLSYKQLLEDPWATAAENFPVGEKITRPVVSLTDYGAFVRLDAGIEGLVHVSELSWSQRATHPKNLVSVGQEIEVVIVDFDEEQRRISLSHKQTLPNPWDAWAEKYSKGSKIKGTVRRFTDFGIFVEIEEGLDGLLRLADISWTERGRDAATQFKAGEEIEVVVIDFQSNDQRLALSVKHLTEDPWVALAKKYPVGSKVTAKVTSLVDFGAFLQVEEGVEGLCHISQLSTDRVEKSSDILKVDQETEIVVIGLDVGKRKMSLSIKALSEGLTEEADYRTLMKEQEQDGFSNNFGRVLSESLGISKADGEADSEASEDESE
jgi:small subunit ribosomal protein S1